MLDCVVVGAGIHGLCTAFWLVQRGVRRVAVCEQFGPAHARGSSHGATRITRSSYDDPEFVALAQRAHREGWPVLARELQTTLLLPTPGVFFGPATGQFADYRRATADCAAITPLAVGAARDRFPLLRFDDDDGVLVDDSAAVVLAAHTLATLRSWLPARGVALHFDAAVTALRARGGAMEVATANGTWTTRHVVLACGPWSGRLHATGLPAFAVQPQHVGYFAVDAAPATIAPGSFPVWVRIGHDAEDFTYGLPSWDGSGLKAAHHRTTGSPVDPDAATPALDDDALLALARARFTCAVRGLSASERCLYTMAPHHRLHVTRDAQLPITTIAACSGHGFKFGPLLGRLAAEHVRA